MKSEIHLFIIWNNALSYRDQFLNDIKQKLTVIDTHDITWSADKFQDNITRFYRKRPDMSDKADRVGRGYFTLVVVKDKRPDYQTRQTSKGEEVVNVNIFDLKEKFRSISGPPNDLIHATNNTIESNHDLTLLLGVNCEDYDNMLPSDRNHLQDNIDLIGHSGWESISQMFYVLNNTIDYIVMRNWQPLPKEFTLAGHGDIDLLVDNLNDAVYILKANPVFPEAHRVHFKVKIGTEHVPFDLRYVGDNYYDINFQKDMLKHKTNIRGFNIPNDYYHFYSLLYHAFIHKHNIKDDYKVTLSNMVENCKPTDFTPEYAAGVLREFLRGHDYSVTRAEPSVRFNEPGVRLILNG